MKELKYQSNEKDVEKNSTFRRKVFGNQKNYKDNELKSAFILYNKYFKRVKIKEDLTQTIENRNQQKSIFGFLKRGLNWIIPL